MLTIKQAWVLRNELDLSDVTFWALAPKRVQSSKEYEFRMKLGSDYVVSEQTNEMNKIKLGWEFAKK